MSAWPELRESVVVQAGRAPGTVIRCGLVDTVLANLPVSVLFCYDQGPDVGRLIDGLAVALDRVPIFAGRMRTVDGELEIVCDDSGVPVTVFDIDEPLTEAITRVTKPRVEYADYLNASAARTGELPMLTVRITRLSDGAMLIGCSWHHAVGDLQSFMMLMRAWSAAVDGLPLPETVAVEDREVHLSGLPYYERVGRPGFKLPDEAELARLTQEIAGAMRANRTVQVYFSDAEIARLRAALSESAGRRLSANDVLCAHLASTIRAVDDDQEERYLILPVNFRRYLDLPVGMVGNLVAEIRLTCAPGSSADTIAGQIRDAVDDFTGSHLNLGSNRAFVDSIGRDRLDDCFPIGFDPLGRTLTITNWSRFGIYDIVFDGRAPVFFSPVSDLPVAWVCWLVEGFDGTGLLCTVVLPARLAGKLRGADAVAELHRYRSPEDVLPAAAVAARKVL